MGDMETMLAEASTRDVHIQIISIIGQSVEYLNVYIENQNGELKTSVFHKTAAEPANDARSVWKQLDVEAYQQLHRKLLYKPTQREQERQDMDSGKRTTKRKCNQQKKKGSVIIHHTFESGPLLDFKSHYRQLWEKTLAYHAAKKNTENLNKSPSMYEQDEYPRLKRNQLTSLSDNFE
ncbi:unnamed protein product, partial [Didymodactylos carnosus]